MVVYLSFSLCRSSTRDDVDIRAENVGATWPLAAPRGLAAGPLRLSCYPTT